MLETLLERYRQHDRQALARLLTLAARGEHIGEIREALKGGRGERVAPRIIAFTGSGGVGKSTLIGKLIEQLRAKGKSVAVLACDPQSPLTGGALLGDRFRMPSRPDDADLFIRSLATAPGQEGVAAHLNLMIELLAGFGFDFILLETVGAGQADTAVRELADVVVLMLQPEAGDDIQWEKAGLLEVADVVVVHKGDLPGAEQVEAQVRGMLNLPGSREIPVLRASASRGQGLAELYELLEKFPRQPDPHAGDGRTLLRLAQTRLAERFRDGDEDARSLLERWRRGELDDEQAADLLLQTLARR